jgi:hypothetical protein
MGTQSDSDMTPEDFVDDQTHAPTLAASSQAIQRSVFFMTSNTTPKKSSRVRKTGCTNTYGALFWTVEIWAPGNKEAGISQDLRLELVGPVTIRPKTTSSCFKWSDEVCGGNAHVDWYPSRHPELRRRGIRGLGPG